MPTYEYQCEKCNHYFTFFTSITNMLGPESEECPKCTEIAVKKVMLSAPSIGDSVRLGIRRPDGGFKEVLQKIHQNVPGSNLNTDSRYI
jgi:putative FmdB family regulatory protein